MKNKKEVANYQVTPSLNNVYLHQLGLNDEETTNKKAQKEAEALVAEYEKNGIKTI